MNNDPIFKSIFGRDWDKLPPVLRKHYANRPYSDDIYAVNGTLDVMCSGPIRIFAWLFWLLKGVPPYNENNVPVTVSFESEPNTAFFLFNRTFNFRTRKTYHFKSKMIQVDGCNVIEVMPFRIAWKMRYLWEDSRVKLKHKGYGLYIFGTFIPLPLTPLMGAGNAEEIAVDENTFDMQVSITHPWWGKLYGYSGRFTLVERS